MTRTRRAFTLVELLVVIGIIAVLMAILLPALAKARQNSKTVQCLSNLRQMAIAAQAYASANHGSYPASHYYVVINNITYTYDWDYCYVTNEQPTPGLLWLGDNSVNVQKCPNWDGQQYTNAGTPFCGYNYNVSYVGGEPQLGLPSDQTYIRCQPAKAGAIPHASRVAMFGDAQNDGFWCNTYMRAAQPSPSEIEIFGSQTNPNGTWAGYDSQSGGAARRAGAQGFRHTRGSNVGFCDGHAETLREVFNRRGMAPDIGFLSQDNSAYGAP